MPRKKHESQAGTNATLSKAWGGRFVEPTDPDVERFCHSFSFDRRLYPYDIQGSIAHVRAICQAGLLTAFERDQMIAGLKKVEAELSAASTCLTPLPSQEDVHMYIEHRLIERIGPVGGKLHAGRSRNDQVSLDLRLYLRDQTHTITKHIKSLQRACLDQAKKQMKVLLPGYTHLQRAQPVLLSHYFLAYYEMLKRDRSRFSDSLQRLNQMPLGAGALAGNGFGINRQAVAKLLGFPSVTANSLDTVSDRDFVVEFLSNAAMLMMHLSRWAEEWILWNTAEFRFIELPDRFCTGSSMMPQKKNPDVLELIRGKTGRVYGALTALLTIMKGLPLSYNRDMQEDKEPLFDTVDTLGSVLPLMTKLVIHTRFQDAHLKDALDEGFLLATEVADYLTRKGLPFREAHRVVGEIVLTGVRTKRPLTDFTLQELRGYSKHFDDDIFDCLTPTGAVERKQGMGGTSTASVQFALRKALAEIKQ